MAANPSHSFRTPGSTRALFMGALEAVAEGVCVVDPEGRVVAANAQAARLLGAGAAALVGCTRYDLATMMEGAPGFPGSTGNPFVAVRVNGRPLEARFQPIAGGGAALLLRALPPAGHDDRREIVEALRAREDALADEGRRRHEFLAMLAHELRNPLGALSLSLYVMERATGDRERLARARVNCNRQVEHLTRMIDDLLDASRITRGKIELRRRRIDLRDSVRNAVAAAKAQTAGDSFAVEVGVRTPAEPVLVDADPTRVEQIVVNLVANAFKFSGKNGRVVVTLESAMEGRRGWAKLRVADNGRGIPGGMLERIFDLFVQVEPAQDRRDTGLGLGLTVVRSLVEMHGGSVKARSRGEGRGAEFVVKLPIAGYEPSIAEMVVPGDLLLVEDDVEVREVLVEVLRDRGVTVRAAASGAEAVALLREAPARVALVDIGLPDVDGYELAGRIRDESPGTRLVALTGFARERNPERDGRPLFDRHLVKPVTAEALVVMLSEVVPDLVPGESH